MTDDGMDIEQMLESINTKHVSAPVCAWFSFLILA